MTQALLSLFPSPALPPKMPGGGLHKLPSCLELIPLLSASLNFSRSVALRAPIPLHYIPGRVPTFLCPGQRSTPPGGVISKRAGAESALSYHLELSPLPWSQTVPHLSSLQTLVPAGCSGKGDVLVLL